MSAFTYFASHLSVKNGSTQESEDGKIADYLLSLGLDAGENQGEALISALHSSATWLVARILDKGVAADTREGSAPVLFIPARNNNVEAIRALLAHGAHIDLEDTETGRTALDEAITRNGRLEALNELILDGADINHLDKENKTPLCLASKSGRQDAATLLIAKAKVVPAMGVCSIEQ